MFNLFRVLFVWLVSWFFSVSFYSVSSLFLVVFLTSGCFQSVFGIPLFNHIRCLFYENISNRTFYLNKNNLEQGKFVAVYVPQTRTASRS